MVVVPVQEDADADAFKNMPKPETFWRLPVRTPEEVAALRRTNFLGFLQETSTVRRVSIALG